jgi:hypothetical protein
MAITTALSPDRTMSIQMIWTTANQNCGWENCVSIDTGIGDQGSGNRKRRTGNGDRDREREEAGISLPAP